MASDSANEESWLYGDTETEAEQPPPPPPPAPSSSDDNREGGTPPLEEREGRTPPPRAEPVASPTAPVIATATATTSDNDDAAAADEDDDDDRESKRDRNEDDTDSDDDDDDDVNVVIGDIKTAGPATYDVRTLNIKRGAQAVDKMKSTAGKFSIDEFESVGSINGVQAQEFNLDSLEDKPWRKPGADITDYFNYGFNEDTWRAYCERQKRMRVHESGVGLAPMNSIGLPRAATSITNDNSKYSGNFAGPRKAGPPPGRRMTGSIDVIGGNSGLASRRGAGGADGPSIGKGTGSSSSGSQSAAAATPPKENVIQVMTADRREYSRNKPTSSSAFPDMSVPPPQSGFDQPPTVFDAGPPPSTAAPTAVPYQQQPGPGPGPAAPDFFNPEPEPYYGGGYEPTQDSQWTGDAAWTPAEIKELTPGPMPLFSTAVPPPQHHVRGYSRDRDRDRNRSEKRDRDRGDRERSHRRPVERSRSRSRRHAKSRSRSPSHRSHRKKKSRRHDKEESD